MESSNSNSGAGAAGADEAAARAAQDEIDRQARIQQQADDAREDAQAAAEEAAKNARELADAAAERAEDDGLVEVTIPQPGVTIRTTQGGVQHFTPGTKRVPKELANALGASPTFATSGDPVADRAVRRTLERDGVVEMATQEQTTARHSSMRGEDADEGTDAELPSGDAQKSGGNARVKPDRTGKQAATLTELRELGAEEVERRYNRAVKAGRVKPVKDGKGSGADGAVVTDDRVQALHDAGEKV